MDRGKIPYRPHPASHQGITAGLGGRSRHGQHTNLDTRLPAKSGKIFHRQNRLLVHRIANQRFVNIKGCDNMKTVFREAGVREKGEP